MAETAVPLRFFINPNDARFAKPDHMPQKIADFCRETNQSAPATPAEFIRCVLESLALLYRQTLDQTEEVTGRRLKTLHIVGGGCRNLLLNQLSANATGRTIVAGPVECTAIGNVLIQALALGHLSSLAEARQVVRSSFPTMRYDPQDATQWDEAYQRFLKFRKVEF
jgi:sugar (pentulose or hexulose) kinase